MQDIASTKNALNTIRSVIDHEVNDSDMQEVKNKLSRLSSLMGLAAEAKASAKKIWATKELEVFAMQEAKMTSYSPTIAKRLLDANCKDEEAVYVYADRLCAAIVHNIEALRTMISLYKVEIEQSMHQ